MTNAVVVATSCATLPGTDRRTGVALPQFGAVRAALFEYGWGVVLASPEGGAVPVDAGSWCEEWAGTASDLADSVALRDLGGTDADAWIVLGGHGALVDLPEDLTLGRLLGLAVTAGRTVVGLDHGAAVLAEVRTSDGVPVVAGLRVTGRSDAEERVVGHHRMSRPSTEQRLRAAGARYSAAPAWDPYAVAEGSVVTGQNPASVSPAMELLLAVERQRLDAA